MKKRLFINLGASVFSFLVQISINFFLTPYIVRKLGSDAYGFLGLANSFVTYATILTVALNSMAGRFISVAINKGNNKEANEYYSSVFIADIILSLFIAVISVIIIFKLNQLISIPDRLAYDVKITFALVFINFIINTMSTVYTVATFVRNRIDIASARNIISNLLMLLVVTLLFVFLNPKIYYIAVASIICSLYLLIANKVITKKILPELQIKSRYFKFTALKILVLSGLWNSVNSLNRVLLTGLDLLISNQFINSAAMGILAISKIIPTAIELLLSTLGSVFTPQYTILYAQNKIDELIKEVKFSIKLLSLIMTVPLSGIIVFGNRFFFLWLPTKTMSEINQIQILSILALAPYLLSAYIYTLVSIDTVTNKLKRPVFVTSLMSGLTIITEITLLKTTNLGLYAIAGVSTFYWVIKILLFNPINAAYNLKIKWNTFYPPFIKAIVCLFVIILVFMIVNTFTQISSWRQLFVISVLCGACGYFINFFMLLSKTERIKVINMSKSFWDKVRI